MNYNKSTELCETISDIIEDVVLVEAMTLRMEHRDSYMVNASPELLEQTFHRILCYLSQHAADLRILTQRSEA